eukprot:augustus_masked-scaffold_1-processed-gene-18.1-mRNA-1 protein AED:0.45 eAED:0.45 QI:0/-1/0/1/-1/1/1/0/1321
MDLGTVNARLHLNYYSFVSVFVKDIEVVYQNCIQYYSAIKQSPELVEEGKSSLKSLDRLVKKKLKEVIENENKAPQVSPAQKQLSPKTGTLSALNINFTEQQKQTYDIPMTPDVLGITQKLLTALMKDSNSFHFLVPVDYKGWNLPHYPKIVKHPMDLGSVSKNLGKKKFKNLLEFCAAVHLVYNNALTFNVEETPEFPIRTMTFKSAKRFHKLLKAEFGSTRPRSTSISPPKERNILVSFPAKAIYKLINKYIKEMKKQLPKGSASLREFLMIQEKIENKEHKFFLSLSENISAKIKMLKKENPQFGRLLEKDFHEALQSLNHNLVMKFGNIFTPQQVGLDYTNFKLKSKVEGARSPENPNKSEDVLPPPPPPPRKKLKLTINASKSSSKQAKKQSVTSKNVTLKTKGKELKPSSHKAHIASLKLSSKSTGKDDPKVVKNIKVKSRKPVAVIPTKPKADVLGKNIPQAPAMKKTDTVALAKSRKILQKTRKLSLSIKSPEMLSGQGTPATGVLHGTKRKLEVVPKGDDARPKKKKKIPKNKKPVFTNDTNVFIPPSKPEGLVLLPQLAPMEKVLLKLSKHDFSKYSFGLPVLQLYTDALFVETYKRIISEPMDLKTVFARYYSTPPVYRDQDEVHFDVVKIFENAITFNSNNANEDFGAKITVEQAMHMKDYYKNLHAERDAAYPLEKFSEIILELYEQNRLSINLGKLDSFNLSPKPEGKKININNFVTPTHLNNDILAEMNLALYLQYPEVLDITSLGKGTVKYTDTGAVPDNVRILYNEFHRLKGQAKFRKLRETMLDTMPLQEANINSLTKIVSKLSHPSKKSLNHYFLYPFNYKEANAPEYPQIIKTPMDLGTLKLNLETKKYKYLGGFATDARLVFANCLLFNKDNKSEYDLKIRRSALMLYLQFEKYLGEATLSLWERNKRNTLARSLQQEEALYKKKQLQDTLQKQKKIAAGTDQNFMVASGRIPESTTFPAAVSHGDTSVIPSSTSSNANAPLGAMIKSATPAAIKRSPEMFKRQREKQIQIQKEEKIRLATEWACRLAEDRAVTIGIPDKALDKKGLEERMNSNSFDSIVSIFFPTKNKKIALKKPRKRRLVENTMFNEDNKTNTPTPVSSATACELPLKKPEFPANITLEETVSSTLLTLQVFKDRQRNRGRFHFLNAMKEVDGRIALTCYGFYSKAPQWKLFRAMSDIEGQLEGSNYYYSEILPHHGTFAVTLSKAAALEKQINLPVSHEHPSFFSVSDAKFKSNTWRYRKDLNVLHYSETITFGMYQLALPVLVFLIPIGVEQQLLLNGSLMWDPDQVLQHEIFSDA